MKRFVLYVGGLIVLALTAMVTTNYLVDPSYVFHNSVIYQMVDSLAEGKYVTGPDNLNERIFKKEFIKKHKGEHFDYIVFGSSRAFLISSEVLDNADVLNLAVSGCTIEDMAALYTEYKNKNS